MGVRLDGDLAILDSSITSYIMEVVNGRLIHRYYGPSLRAWHDSSGPLYAKTDYAVDAGWSIAGASPDDVPVEYPVRGRGDFRNPALAVRLENGSRVIEPLFVKWKVHAGKPKLPGLPATFGTEEECQTLETVLEDKACSIRIRLYHTVFENLGVVAQHQIVENTGCGTVLLEEARSATLHLPADEWDTLILYGAHAKEANVSRKTLGHGILCVENTRGSSGPQHQAFLALLAPGTSETLGLVYGLQLIYSGNFMANAHRSEYGEVRAQIGVHSESLHWPLGPGEAFCTPEAVIACSDAGLNGMSHTFHRLYARHLMPRRFANIPSPILLNTWEAMYYDVSLQGLERQAELAAKVGMELLVLDDGWFRTENSSRAPIGDWEWNEDKIPGGIEAAAAVVRAHGLQFGLWFEPEAASKQSRLAMEHPDWILRDAVHEPLEGRHEYLLDLTRADVRDHIERTLGRYLETGCIDYVKWDMNRPMTDMGSAALSAEQQGTVPHRYILGLYDVLNRITSRFPNVRIETCSSGGCRFDPGMLYYAPQNWASDNTDALDRIVIQNGFSLMYPPTAIGAHVSAIPNHRTGRLSSLDARFAVARLFNAGYEMDLSRLFPDELLRIQEQIRQLKEERAWLQSAVFWRHDVPSSAYAMWSAVAQDGSQVLALVFQRWWDPLQSRVRFKLLGLDAGAEYRNVPTGAILGGDELMRSGFSLSMRRGDMEAYTFRFERL